MDSRNFTVRRMRCVVIGFGCDSHGADYLSLTTGFCPRTLLGRYGCLQGFRREIDRTNIYSKVTATTKERLLKDAGAK